MTNTNHWDIFLQGTLLYAELGNLYKAYHYMYRYMNKGRPLQFTADRVYTSLLEWELASIEWDLSSPAVAKVSSPVYRDGDIIYAKVLTLSRLMEFIMVDTFKKHILWMPTLTFVIACKIYCKLMMYLLYILSKPNSEWPNGLNIALFKNDELTSDSNRIKCMGYHCSQENILAILAILPNWLYYLSANITVFTVFIKIGLLIVVELHWFLDVCGYIIIPYFE